MIAIGGNCALPGQDLMQMLVAAVERVAQEVGPVAKMSPWYRTPAFPAGSGPDFLNAAFCVDTPLSAGEVIHALHKVEAEFSRDRSERWAARTVDLDLIADGDQVAPDVATWRYWADLSMQDQQQKAPTQLILPHPRMQDRSFVLVPLMNICPDWVHPVLGLSVAQMHANLTDKDVKSVVKVADPACQ